MWSSSSSGAAGRAVAGMTSGAAGAAVARMGGGAWSGGGGAGGVTRVSNSNSGDGSASCDCLEDYAPLGRRTGNACGDGSGTVSHGTWIASGGSCVYEYQCDVDTRCSCYEIGGSKYSMAGAGYGCSDGNCGDDPIYCIYNEATKKCDCTELCFKKTDGKCSFTLEQAHSGWDPCSEKDETDPYSLLRAPTAEDACPESKFLGGRGGELLLGGALVMEHPVSLSSVAAAAGIALGSWEQLVLSCVTGCAELGVVCTAMRGWDEREKCAQCAGDCVELCAMDPFGGGPGAWPDYPECYIPV